jgi:YVTN family beta-propeller protein
MHTHLIRALAIPAAVIGTLALAGAAAPPWAGSPPPTAFVTNFGSNTVTPINTATNKAGTPIKVGPGPSNILMAPNGKTAYINGNAGVTPVNTVTHRAGKLIAIKTGVADMAITPNGKTLYVMSYTGAFTTVFPVSTATGKVGKPVLVVRDASWGGLQSSLLVTPNGKTLYFASTLGTVTPVSTATGKVGKPIRFQSGESFSADMAITPNGKTLYAFENGPNQLWNTVTPINTATSKAGSPIKVGQFPVAIVFSLNGKTAYVASTGAIPFACTSGSPRCSGAPAKPVPARVTPISTVTNRPGKAIILGPTAYVLTMAITPNGRTVYVGDSWIVTNHSAYAVIPISTATGTAGKLVKVGWAPRAMAIAANGKTVYCVGANSSGQGFVMPIGTATGTALKAIQVGNSPTAIAIAP